MFVHYSGPSSKQTPKTRRAANAFKAAQAQACRVRDPARGTFQWLHIPKSPQNESSSSNEDPSWSAQQDQMLLARAAVAASLTSCVVGSERFYPIREKGPLTMSALSHYFDVIFPHDLEVQGLGEAGKGTYGAGLLNWSAHHTGVCHGLVAFTLCSLDTKTDVMEQAILYHRQKILQDVHERLEQGQVDDVLIQAICLLIPVDDYLGYVEYGPVHLKGLSDIVNIRGGLKMVGSSDPIAFGKILQLTMLTVVSMIEFHMRTKFTSETFIPATSLSSAMQIKISAMPAGLRDLFRAGILSAGVIPILESYQTWFSQTQKTDIWRSPVPPGLNNIESCLVITLVCLADDTSAMILHPAASMFRKTRQRIETVLNTPGLWSDPRVVDCMIWMTTVISVPPGQFIDVGLQKQVLKKAIQGRVFVLEWEEIQCRLQKFYYSELRVGDWKRAWDIALDEI
ncbi:hypothetical protein BJX64DRAFT_207430 [Aspergillus heterothallicus]